MNNTVFKTSLIHYTISQKIQVPKGAEFLSAQYQGDNISVWYLCNPSSQLEEKTIIVLTTGQTANIPLGKFLGTVQYDGAVPPYVVHVFAGV